MKQKRFKLSQFVLFIATIPIGEIHTFWEGTKKSWNHVLFYTFSFNYSLQWYIKDQCEMVKWVLVSIIIYRFSKFTQDKLLISFALTYVFWQFYDILMYWINYKTFGYGFVYLALLLTWTLIYIRKKKIPS